MRIVPVFQRSLAIAAAIGLLAGCKGGGGSQGGGGIPPTPTPPSSAYACPTSGATPGLATAGVASRARRRPRRALQRPAYVPHLLAVAYRRTTFLAARARVHLDDAQLGVHALATHDYPRIEEVSRIVRVAPGGLARAMAALRAQPGVVSVSRVGRRYPSAVTTPYFTNDPYFRGFAPTTAPYYESADVPGQWDLHAIGLENAFAYSQNGNGSGIVNAGALGLRTVSVAIIDTGEDLTHPDLAGSKVIHTGCFITDPTSGVQSTGIYVTDRDGHGTDVAGIAAANINNALGFAGAGGNVALMAYRVFPRPNDSCLGSSPGPQCSTSTADVASAIDDAVKAGANVINMSFGGCSSSGPPCCPDDSAEGPAVANAISSGVIVVAAAGNDGRAELEAPACDKGVIAVGATGLADGVRNGTNDNASGEYVAGYSSYGTGNWGLVAPGGDPYCPGTGNCADSDNLHWIENIYTSTPLDSNFAGDCSPDFGNPNGRADCKILIAGTSMATPEVAGSAALILSATGTRYQSAAKMFALLCATADNIGAAHQGCGRLNVYRAMATALNDPNPPPAAAQVPRS